MTNKYGAALDRAGYAASIMQTSKAGRCCCYLCGRATGYNKLDRHEPWGAANRSKSKELGLWVLLCHEGCHEGPGSVHADAEKARELRRDAQRAAMLRYGWSREDWIAEFGKSELSEEEASRLIVLPKAAERAASATAGNRKTVGDIIHELWPGHPTTTTFGTQPSEAGAGRRGGGAVVSSFDAERRSEAVRSTTTSFRVIDGPELPY